MVALGLFNIGRWRVISWVSSTNAFLGVTNGGFGLEVP